MCGEQREVRPQVRAILGSPPRVRGTDAPDRPDESLPGITPACAGNRGRPRSGQRSRGDHPRVCGEQGCPFDCKPPGLGSPPRVRGTAASVTAKWAAMRITPACAGNSPLAVTRSAFAKDHPRVCGEQRMADLAMFSPLGSPPRVRGTAFSASISICPSGITPACAGNSLLRLRQPKNQWDHPRVCGEQCTGSFHARNKLGSPPRVRGTGCRPFL